MVKDSSAVIVHGTCVSIDGKGVLLRGAPGSGKSDLALRVLYSPPSTWSETAVLVADDRVILKRQKETVLAECPPELSGLIEVRGIGLVPVFNIGNAPLKLLIDLGPSCDVPRFPDPIAHEQIFGIAFPRLDLDPFEASAALKLVLAIRKFV